jgi:hypothetical protein
MRGQLFNIAYKFVDTAYMCYIDNDMFFPEYIDLVSIYNNLGCKALQPFNVIRQVAIKNNGEIETISEAPKNIHGKGGVTFISKSKFEDVGGMSNLYIGYGCEDTDFDYRCNGIVDIDATICHIQHERRNNDTHWGINKKISSDKDKRNISQDNYNHTQYTITSDKTEGNVKYISVKDITVHKNFAYNAILKRHGI